MANKNQDERVVEKSGVAIQVFQNSRVSFRAFSQRKAQVCG
jgi:hypothetical protein